MYDVVITDKQSGKVVAQIRASVQGQNYDPTPAEYHAQALRTAVKD